MIEALVSANQGSQMSYGNDVYTQKAKALIQSFFKKPVDMAFVSNGTAANIIGLQLMLRPYQAVICADTAHINNEEAGAFERFTGSKLLTLPHAEGKLTPEAIAAACYAIGDEHRVQPKAVSITQLSEAGTAYSVQEIRAISEVCKEYDLYLHMDGSRISSALVATGASLSQMLEDTGVDVVSFGGTKNGLVYGEVVICLNPDLGKHLKFIHKQAMQMHSKTRFISAQFDRYFTDDLYLDNARHANDMMAQLVRGLEDLGIQPVFPVDGCIVFYDFTKDQKAALSSIPTHDEHFPDGSFYTRLVTGWNTRQAEIDQIISLLKA